MTVELVRTQTANDIDSNFPVTFVLSLLGLTFSLALLPVLDADFPAFLALAG